MQLIQYAQSGMYAGGDAAIINIAISSHHMWESKNRVSTNFS